MCLWGLVQKNESHSSSTSWTLQAESSLTQRGASCASQYISVNHCTGCLFVNESSSKSLRFCKALKGVRPGYLSNLFIWRTWKLQIHQVVQKRLTQGFQSHKQSKASFSYYAPHLWNDLPGCLRTAITVQSALHFFSYFNYFNKTFVFFLAIPNKCISVFML